MTLIRQGNPNLDIKSQEWGKTTYIAKITLKERKNSAIYIYLYD